MAICPSCATRVLGTFHLVLVPSELFLGLCPVFWSGRAGQILFMEFLKDGSADNVTNLHLVIRPNSQ